MVNPQSRRCTSRQHFCEQCHLAGEARVEKTGKHFAVSAGDLLVDFASYFVFEGPADPRLKATGYVEKFQQSRCRR